MNFNRHLDKQIQQHFKSYKEVLTLLGSRQSGKTTLLNRLLRDPGLRDTAVIINEFGAYDRTSRLQDRVNYLTDAVSIFEELEIPWQQWFMLMDANGTVDPAIRKALRLGE